MKCLGLALCPFKLVMSTEVSPYEHQEKPLMLPVVMLNSKISVCTQKFSSQLMTTVAKFGCMAKIAHF